MGAVPVLEALELVKLEEEPVVKAVEEDDETGFSVVEVVSEVVETVTVEVRVVALVVADVLELEYVDVEDPGGPVLVPELKVGVKVELEGVLEDVTGLSVVEEDG